MNQALPGRIVERAAAAGVPVPAALAEAAVSYLVLLEKWNRTINLTGFRLDPPSDAALDRLIVEPFAAAIHVRADDRRVIDVGSGGGSPAIPLKLARPELAMVLVESKARKVAFLREAVRALALRDVRLEHGRVEDLAGVGDWPEGADLITVRAVRIGTEQLDTFARLLRPSGRVFAFGETDEAGIGSGFRACVNLRPGARSVLTILERNQKIG